MHTDFPRSDEQRHAEEQLAAAERERDRAAKSLSHLVQYQPGLTTLIRKHEVRVERLERVVDFWFQRARPATSGDGDGADLITCITPLCGVTIPRARAYSHASRCSSCWDAFPGNRSPDRDASNETAPAPVPVIGY